MSDKITVRSKYCDVSFIVEGKQASLGTWREQDDHYEIDIPIRPLAELVVERRKNAELMSDIVTRDRAISAKDKAIEALRIELAAAQGVKEAQQLGFPDMDAGIKRQRPPAGLEEIIMLVSLGQHPGAIAIIEKELKNRGVLP